MPQELKEWQEENQVKNIDDADLAKELKKIFKDMGFTPSLTPTSNTTFKTSKKKPSGSSKSQLTPSVDNKKSTKKLTKKLILLRNLKNCIQPNYAFINDEEAPLCEFHLTEYKMLINVGSPLYKYRKERILNSLQEVCLVKDFLDFNLKKHIFINSCYRILKQIFFAKMIP